MLAPPVPHDEAKRLAALFDYHILDSPPESSFDELTELVANVLDVPIALVSLIDEDRQWFKSHHGLDASETPRDYAFCGHAILDDKLFVVEDSHVDERFKDNPLVTGDPGVRFYAGMPLITVDGYRIGTVCGIDHKPRALSESQKRILDIVSRQVIDQLELRKNIALKEDLFKQQNHSLKQLESANQEIRDFVSVVAHDLRAPVLNASGFASELLADIRELEVLLEQSKNAMPSDLRHDLLEIIHDDLIDSTEHIQRSASQMNERISAISLIAKYGRRELQPESVDLEKLVSEICSEHDMDIRNCSGEIKMNKLPHVHVDKMSLQLVLENIVANAVKYRAPERPLHLEISAAQETGGVVVTVADNGRGIQADDLSNVFVMFRRVGEQNTQGDGTGMAFSRTIASRLGGRLWCESVVEQGTSFHVFLPTEQLGGLKAAAAD